MHANLVPLLSEASATALAIDEAPARVMMLAELASVCEKFDPGWARRLLDKAEDAAGLIGDPSGRALASAAVASVIAASNQPESARQPKSARLFDAAEGAAAVIRETEMKSKTFAAIVQMMADSDPERAKNIAWNIANPDQKDWALAYLAKALAREDPVQAEILAKSITGKWPKSWALTALVEAARKLERTNDTVVVQKWSPSGFSYTASDGQRPLDRR